MTEKYLVIMLNESDIPAPVVCGLKNLKEIPKNKIFELYAMTEVKYDDVLASEKIRTCICEAIKDAPIAKNDVIDYVMGHIKTTKKEVNIVLSQMKKENKIYYEKEFGWVGLVKN